LELDGSLEEDNPEKIIFSVINKIEPLLAIRSNTRIIKDKIIKKGEKTYIILAVNNEYKYRVIFALSLISKFYKAKLLTIMNSGNIKKINAFKF
jgi:RNase P/RNase MRP subunit POP5